MSGILKIQKTSKKAAVFNLTQGAIDSFNRLCSCYQSDPDDVLIAIIEYAFQNDKETIESQKGALEDRLVYLDSASGQDDVQKRPRKQRKQAKAAQLDAA